jgi:nucleoside-diphosphate-sugar epimerase
MKVLVTGASGYIGRQLADKLSAAVTMSPVWSVMPRGLPNFIARK